MQSRNHPIALLSRSLLASTFVLALGGFTAGSCFGPVEDPPDPLPPTECSFDAECGDGFYCDLDEPIVADAPIHPSNCVDLSGICRPLEGCLSDADCGPGALCSILEIACPADAASGEPECFEQVGVCIEAPADGCQSDADCPDGYCESFATCLGLGCPPAPPSSCVYPACDTGDEIFCDMVPPVCAAGETLAVQGGCWACLDARSCEAAVCAGVSCAAGEHCEPESVACVVEPCGPVPVCVPDPQPDPCFGAWTDELGTCRAPNDGTLPAECCAGMCTTDAECGPDGSCWDGLCVPGPATCPGESDPRVSYVCQGSECWVIGAWICPAGQEIFSNPCGSGCIDSGLCTGLDETACRADALCEALYGASACDPSGVCTTDMAFQGCTPIF